MRGASGRNGSLQIQLLHAPVTGVKSLRDTRSSRVSLRGHTENTRLFKLIQAQGGLSSYGIANAAGSLVDAPVQPSRHKETRRSGRPIEPMVIRITMAHRDRDISDPR